MPTQFCGDESGESGREIQPDRSRPVDGDEPAPPCLAGGEGFSGEANKEIRAAPKPIADAALLALRAWPPAIRTSLSSFGRLPQVELGLLDPAAQRPLALRILCQDAHWASLSGYLYFIQYYFSGGSRRPKFSPRAGCETAKRKLPGKTSGTRYGRIPGASLL